MLEPLFNKFVELKARNFIKKRVEHRDFPVNIDIFLRTAFLENGSCGCFLLFIVNISLSENHRSILQKIYCIFETFMTSICEGKIPAEVWLIHAEQMSLYNFIIL